MEKETKNTLSKYGLYGIYKLKVTYTTSEKGGVMPVEC